MKNLIKKFWRFFKNSSKQRINPDEVFIDALNLPEFDTHQFEGHLEKPIPKYIIFITGIFFFIITSVFIYQSFKLQVVNGEEYLNLSKNNRLEYSPIFANRGTIKDRLGTNLAWNIPGGRNDFSLRRYIGEEGLSHLLGYIKYPTKDNSGFYYRNNFKGKDGIEKTMNEKLNGENGLKIIEINALSETVSESEVRSEKDGDCVELSIDSRVQSAMHNFIKKTALENDFRGGAGVMMNVKNGETLAITSWPEYNSQVLSKGEEDIINSYNKNPNKPFLNRAIAGLYAPGSIIKPFIALAALEENVISPQKEILSTGSISIPNPYYPKKTTIFKDWKAHGLVNMKEALAVSSNVYFYEIGGGYEKQKGLGIDRIKKYMKLFGMGGKTGIKLNSEKKGVIPSPKWKKENFEDGTWRIGDTYHTTIGQYGFQTTPIQMARAISTISNGGGLNTPVLIKNTTTEKTELPFKSENLEVVKSGMRQAVKEGTATGLDVGYVKVAAKTGTAETGSVESRVNSWVIGFFPYKNPKYSFAVVMEEGLFKNHIGGVYVMRQLFDWMHQNTPEYLVQ